MDVGERKRLSASGQGKAEILESLLDEAVSRLKVKEMDTREIRKESVVPGELNQFKKKNKKN